MCKKLYNRTMDEKIRINKYLSEAGICSRREADRMIEEGRITVNGKKAESGQKVSLEDEVCADNIPVHKNEKKVLLLFNKPRGIVCSTKQQFDETTVTDYLDYPLRVYPVGRLDKDTEGLLIITNDGETAHRLLSPKKHVDKTYFVRTSGGEIGTEEVEKLENGVDIGEEKLTLPAEIEILKNGEISESLLTIREGKFHQVKRMFKAVGREVIYLKRISMGNIKLDESLEKGECRKLSEDEIKIITGEKY